MRVSVSVSYCCITNTKILLACNNIYLFLAYLLVSRSGFAPGLSFVDWLGSYVLHIFILGSRLKGQKLSGGRSYGDGRSLRGLSNHTSTLQTVGYVMSTGSHMAKAKVRGPGSIPCFHETWQGCTVDGYISFREIMNCD